MLAHMRFRSNKAIIAINNNSEDNITFQRFSNAIPSSPALKEAIWCGWLSRWWDWWVLLLLWLTRIAYGPFLSAYFQGLRLGHAFEAALGRYRGLCWDKHSWFRKIPHAEGWWAREGSCVTCPGSWGGYLPRARREVSLCISDLPSAARPAIEGLEFRDWLWRDLLYPGFRGMYWKEVYFGIAEVG